MSPAVELGLGLGLCMRPGAGVKRSSLQERVTTQLGATDRHGVQLLQSRRSSHGTSTKLRFSPKASLRVTRSFIHSLTRSLWTLFHKIVPESLLVCCGMMSYLSLSFVVALPGCFPLSSVVVSKLNLSPASGMNHIRGREKSPFSNSCFQITSDASTWIDDLLLHKDSEQQAALEESVD